MGDDVFFVDADCYSRLTRVSQVLAHPFQRIAHHDFENSPAGTDPHTTSPFDYLIGALSLIAGLFTTNPLDVAGAWVSPLIAFGLIGFLWWWLGRELPRFRFAALLIVAVSPPVVQAFKLGRPDHQSLTLALVTAGFAAELSLRRNPTRSWAIAWGLLWGLALWVTLYEPVILLTLVLLTRLLRFTDPKSRAEQSETASQIPFRRKEVTQNPKFLEAVIIAAGTFLLGVLLDGWRLGPLPPEVAEYFPRWSTLLGELNSVPPFSSVWITWFGYLLPAVIPLAIWNRYRTQPNDSFFTSHSALLIPLLVATYGLTIWQVRWSPFFIIPAALLLPTALSAIPRRSVAWIIFVISLLPLASAWDSRFFPNANVQAALDDQRTENVLLRRTALALVSEETIPVLAPWWLCPAIAYWSGQPCVGGSSHQSLPGIVDTARVYLAKNSTEARTILDAREVRALIAYEPDRLISSSAVLLDQPPTPDVLATAIFRNADAVPGFRIADTNPYFKIFLRKPSSRETPRDAATE